MPGAGGRSDLLRAGPGSNCRTWRQLPPRGELSIGYLIPLSYGIPSAFGAREFLDVSESTIRVMTKGIIM